MVDSSGMTWALVLAGVVILLPLLVGGVFMLVRYFKTRQIGWLIGGLVCTLLLPGLLLCCIVAYWLPSQMVVYAPPPPDLP